MESLKTSTKQVQRCDYTVTERVMNLKCDANLKVYEGDSESNHELQMKTVNDVNSRLKTSICLGDDNCNNVEKESMDEGEEEDEIQINHLPCELLDYIFTFLSIEERIKTECVCKKWRRLGSEHHWPVPNYLNFDDWEWEKKIRLSDEIVTAVLSRCGPFVKIIQLTNLNFQLTGKVVHVICHECRNLVNIELRLPTVALPKNCLDGFGECCPKLDSVVLEYNGKEDLVFRSFFDNCKLLTGLALSGKKLCPKSHDIEVINKNLTYLRLNCYGCLQPEFLRTLMERCHSIETLHLGNFDRYKLVSRELLIETVLYYSKTLRTLDLTAYKESRILSHLNEFSNLQSLLICWPYEPNNCQNKLKFEVTSRNIRLFHAFGGSWDLDTYSIQNILDKNDYLTNLCLSSCTVSPEVFKICEKYKHTLIQIIFESIRTSCKSEQWCELFASLTNLETLMLHHCGTEVNDEVVEALAKSCLRLETLQIIHPYITDDGLLAISLLPNLRDVDLSGLECISDNGIAALATLRWLEVLKISMSLAEDGRISERNSKITDVSCSLLARNCPEFRALYAEGVPNLTNNLVAAFCESLQFGILKHKVALYLVGTLVTTDHPKHEKLAVKFDEDDFVDFHEEELTESDDEFISRSD